MKKQEKTLTGYPSIDKPWLKYYNETEMNYTIPKCKIVDNLYKYIDKYKNEIALEFIGTYKRNIRNLRSSHHIVFATLLPREQLKTECSPRRCKRF